MKKFHILFLVLLFCFACSSGKSDTKETDASDSGETEIQDTDSDKTDTEPSETDSDSMTDNDTTTPGGDSETSDSDMIEDGGCEPDPCDTEENRAAHKSRCMPEENGTKHSCICDVNYYDDNGLCCQAHSSNKGGKCLCNTDFTELEEEPGKCVAKCTENTWEGLNGYCQDGKICQQGTCITDYCAGHTCPENSTCTTKNDEAFCQCENPLQMSNGKCCPQNSTNVNGTCKCNAGYEQSGEECVMSANNPCRNKPCSQANNPGQPNKNTCVADSSAAGYHCKCNTNYEEGSDGKCNEIVYEVCPDNTQCLGGYCLPHDLSREQCIKNSDCGIYSGNESMTCNAAAAGGVCMYCSDSSDCPGNSQCMGSGYGTCALTCDSNDDCPSGDCSSLGYCRQKSCSTDEDCFNGTVCKYSTGEKDGMCQRPACHETACSFSNPGGTCPNSNEACINGECISSCSPNPCHDTNKSKCTIKFGVPTCECDAGTVEKEGKCVPKTVKTCPSGFLCKDGYCADKNEINFFCAENSDCGGNLECSSRLPSGRCEGCTYNSDCPAVDENDPVYCISGYCMRSCFSNEECGPAMICKTNTQGSFCGSLECSKISDCNAANYTCTPSSGSSASGTCTRIPCEQ